MPRSRSPAALPGAIRRQLDVSAAVARERVKEVHLSYALELVERAEQEIEPRRALDIYSRLHKLGEAEAHALGNDVFMALGRRGFPAPPSAPPAAQEGAWGAPESILRQIRRRIRGRVNAELREWVEYHTGRAEAALLWAHVDNAEQFVQVLEPIRSPAEAVALYADMLGLAPPRTEILYFLVLDQRAARADEMRRRDPAPPARGPRRPADRHRPSLRVVEKRREPGRHQTG